jgi:hypothetical protein
MNTAEVSFQGKHNAYTCSLPDLGPAPGDAYLDAQLANATTAATPKSGYFFQPGACPVQAQFIAPVTTPAVSYQWWGQPAVAGTTGTNAFCTDTSAVIKKDPGGAGPACLAGNTPIG